MYFVLQFCESQQSLLPRCLFHGANECSRWLFLELALVGGPPSDMKSYRFLFFLWLKMLLALPKLVLWMYPILIYCSIAYDSILFCVRSRYFDCCFGPTLMHAFRYCCVAVATYPLVSPSMDSQLFLICPGQSRPSRT